jgi:hypothetical protein
MNVAILTTFMEFLPGYSLTGIVKDQAEMLARYNNTVHLFVSEKYHGETFSENVNLHKKIPFTHQKDYKTIRDLTPEHAEIRKKTCNMLVEELTELEIDVVFTHDFIFTGWFMPFGLACQDAGKRLPNMAWLHWVHSCPSVMSDWWYIRNYGPRHKIVYPNISDRTRVAEQFRGWDDDVRIIPHIKDLRTFFEFDDGTRELIDNYPGIMQADIVCLLPASVDRLASKRVGECLDIMANIKAMNKSVMFIIANQWATGKQQKQDCEPYRIRGQNQGLVSGKDFFFTSDYSDGKWGVGIPMRMIRELFLCTNLFLFPTREESFGLVVPEASLAGGGLLVLNKDLQQQIEISGNTAMYAQFGSFHIQFKPPGPKYFEDLAKIILGRMEQNEGIKTKTFMRKTYNMDNLYKKYYAPIMAELVHS